MPNWKVFEVHLNDEIPRVGSGKRTVEADVGRKFVYVRRWTRYSGKALRKSRLTLAAWTALNPTPMENVDAIHHEED